MFIKYGKFIWTNAIADLRHRFSGSVAGWVWNVIAPLAQLAVFAVVFSGLMGRQNGEIDGPKGTFSFIILLCSGLLAWNAFAETVMRSTTSLVGNAGFLKKLPLPEQIFVAKEALAGYLTALISIFIYLIFCASVARYGPYVQWVQAIPLLLLFMWLAYGMGVILACLNVFFRDVAQLMNVVMLLWMWLTPVVYSEREFIGSKHEWLMGTVFKINPAYYYIVAFHDCLFRSVWISQQRWMVCFGIALVVNIVAAMVVRLLRAQIRDVI